MDGDEELALPGNRRGGQRGVVGHLLDKVAHEQTGNLGGTQQVGGATFGGREGRVSRGCIQQTVAGVDAAVGGREVGEIAARCDVIRGAVQRLLLRDKCYRG